MNVFKKPTNETAVSYETKYKKEGGASYRYTTKKLVVRHTELHKDATIIHAITLKHTIDEHWPFGGVFTEILAITDRNNPKRNKAFN